MSARKIGWLMLIAILGGPISNAERLSGLYVDNGFDQTVIHRVINNREKREVEYEILDLLGLPDRPRNTIHRPPQVKRSAPKFLLDIYKNTLDGGDKEEKSAMRYHKAGEFDLSGQDLKAIDQSDVIITFAAHNHHVAGVRHERGKRLWFDVSEIPPEEYIIGAELRLYQSTHVKNRKNHGSHTITVYQVLKIENGTRELQYIDAVNVTSSKEGWLTLNISEALDHWVNNPDGNRGLYLSVHSADRSVSIRDTSSAIASSCLPTLMRYIYEYEMCSRRIQEASNLEERIREERI
ncbi:protein 60A [Pogonomyrmex barbatus]|uniref:Protein 60A n=1 Tax=Pogonomyrmex barbatus TaxID=144034 RepID=A0A6I9XPS8_9HYME|nr:protein 60A [Pogonomyrmex barbatus]